jgi:hypothetical protein
MVTVCTPFKSLGIPRLFLLQNRDVVMRDSDQPQPVGISAVATPVTSSYDFVLALGLTSVPPAHEKWEYHRGLQRLPLFLVNLRQSGHG